MQIASCSFVGLILTSFVACSTSSTDTTAPDAASSQDAGVSPDSALADAAQDAAGEASNYDAGAIVAARPYTLHVPTGYDAAKPTPLVLLFHGYGATGMLEELVFRMTSTSDAQTFLYAYGEGTTDQDGSQFWSATDACCNLYGSSVDDVQYFDAIVDDIAAKYNVDKKRVYAIGHSNGAFMAHRLACERASRVAAIVALAGDNYLDASKCNPSEHVSVLQVHGDADQTILYAGGATKEGMYPSAHASVGSWAQKNGCTGALAATGQTLDLDTGLAGSETKVETYGGCPAGIDVTLDTIQGGAHIPAFAHPAWNDTVWGFLSAHPKP
jgi:polyhydroxybutyrate depolymerase